MRDDFLLPVHLDHPRQKAVLAHDAEDNPVGEQGRRRPRPGPATAAPPTSRSACRGRAAGKPPGKEGRTRDDGFLFRLLFLQAHPPFEQVRLVLQKIGHHQAHGHQQDGQVDPGLPVVQGAGGQEEHGRQHGAGQAEAHDDLFFQPGVAFARHGFIAFHTRNMLCKVPAINRQKVIFLLCDDKWDRSIPVAGDQRSPPGTLVIETDLKSSGSAGCGRCGSGSGACPGFSTFPGCLARPDRFAGRRHCACRRRLRK